MSPVTTSRAHGTRQRLLDAAEHVLLDEGAESLTLDAVAASAGVSKGGLLYHFGTKEALVVGVVSRAVETVDAELHRASASAAPGDFARAYIDLCLPAQDARDAGKTNALSAALIGVATVDPALIEPLRTAFGRWQSRLENDKIDIVAASVIRLAVDGWWLAEVLDLPKPTVTPTAIRTYLEGLLKSPPRPQRSRRRATNELQN